MRYNEVTLLTEKLNDQKFRAALSQFATGVAIVTTNSSNGMYLGLTISSFNSVSLEPPLVLWSLSNRAKSMPFFAENSHYVINILSAQQTKLAQQFSSRVENRFDGVEFSLSPERIPIIAGVSAWFECENRSRYPEGDHVIFVGRVTRCEFDPQAPLIFHNSQFM